MSMPNAEEHCGIIQSMAKHGSENTSLSNAGWNVEGVWQLPANPHPNSCKTVKILKESDEERGSLLCCQCLPQDVLINAVKCWLDINECTKCTKFIIQAKLQDYSSDSSCRDWTLRNTFDIHYCERQWVRSSFTDFGLDFGLIHELGLTSDLTLDLIFVCGHPSFLCNRWITAIIRLVKSTL